MMCIFIRCRFICLLNHLSGRRYFQVLDPKYRFLSLHAMDRTKKGCLLVHVAPPYADQTHVRNTRQSPPQLDFHGSVISFVYNFHHLSIETASASTFACRFLRDCLQDCLRLQVKEGGDYVVVAICIKIDEFCIL